MSHVPSVPPVKPSTQIFGDFLTQKTKDMHTMSQRVKFLQSAWNQPLRAVNATGMVVDGGLKVARGNVLGVGPILSGGKELYNMATEEHSELDRTLGNIKAAASMIGVVAENQRERFQKMRETVTDIDREVSALYAKLNEISKMSTFGSEVLKAKKQAALELNQRSILAYHKAKKLYIAAQKDTKKANAIFYKCTDLSRRILADILDIEKGRKSPNLEKMCKQSVDSSIHAQAFLNEADLKFDAAFAAFAESNRLKNEAIEQLHQSQQVAAEIFEKIQDKAQYKKESEDKLADLQRQLIDAENGTKRITKLVTVLQREVQKAKEEAARLWTSVSLVAMFASTYTFAKAGFGLFATGAGAGSATMAVACRQTVMRTARAAVNYFMSAPPQEPIVWEDRLFVVQFDTISSGGVGMVCNRPSHSVGLVYARLGDQVMNLPFNFNADNNNPVSNETRVSLFLVLRDMLIKREITPTQCLAIIQEGQALYFDRGEDSEGHMGIFNDDDETSSIIVDELKELCERMISAG